MPFITYTHYTPPNQYDTSHENIGVFITELITYFNKVGSPDSVIPSNVTTLDELNCIFLGNFHSYYILDTSFTRPNCPIELLSPQSKSLLGYFYGIHFRTHETNSSNTILPYLPTEIWELIWTFKHGLDMNHVHYELLTHLVYPGGCGGYCSRGDCSDCKENYRVWKPCSHAISLDMPYHHDTCILVQHKNTITCKKNTKFRLPNDYISDCQYCIKQNYFCSVTCENIYDYRLNNVLHSNINPVMH